MPIRVLSDEVVSQIAAGEIVERPASVVKELVENALDAQATQVKVETSGGGRRLMRVSDDGSGIAADDVELAFLRHATSKLESAGDLEKIATLGFRGEALASIAAVSQLTATTRSMYEDMGTFLRIEGGVVIQQRSVGAPLGSVLAVENLFFNTPARLKFLKSDSTEKRHIAALVTRYAMAYPNVRFILEQDGREGFRSVGSGNLADAVVVVLGLDKFKQMIEIDTESGSIRISGFVSLPSLSRSDRTHITLFVNGRWVNDSSLSYAVTQAYHTLLMTGRYPLAVLMIDMPPDEVDVNVHPTKAEVRFRDANAVFTAVQRAVRRTIMDSAQAYPVHGGRFSGVAHTKVEDTWEGEEQLNLALAIDEPGQYAHQNVAGLDEIDGSDQFAAIPEGLGAPTRPRTLPPLRVVGQVGATYIVAEGPAGMYLVDQHAAHERVLYEQLMERQARQEPISQLALEAQTIEFAPVEARIVEGRLNALRETGFDLEPFGVNTFVIRSIPALLADVDPVEAVGSIIDDLTLGNEPGADSVEEKIISHVCKRAAVKAGQVLSIAEMRSLVQQLERCESPHTCPHGRPTMLHMSSNFLAREFGRR